MRIDPVLALVALFAVNALAFAAQGLDKWRASRGTTRTRERTLLLLGLPLAAPGMWLGMRLFRHKTSKTSFLVGAWLVTLANIAMAGCAVEALRRGWLAIEPLR